MYCVAGPARGDPMPRFPAYVNTSHLHAKGMRQYAAAAARRENVSSSCTLQVAWQSLLLVRLALHALLLHLLLKQQVLARHHPLLHLLHGLPT